MDTVSLQKNMGKVLVAALVLSLTFSAQTHAEELVLTEAELCEMSSVNVPNHLEGCVSAKKTYMYCSAVTDETSDQYKFLYSGYCYTDPNGLIKYNNRYCIAIGTGYTKNIGDRVTLVLEDGSIVRCVVGALKAPVHTDSSNRYDVADGSVAEFIVDKKVFNSVKDGSGTVNFIDGMEGEIIKVVTL